MCVITIHYLRTANHSNYLPMQADLPIFRSRSILAESTALKFMHRHGLDGDLTITQLTWLWTEGDAYPLILLSGSFNGHRFLADQRCTDFQWCVSLRARNPSEVQSYGFLLRLLDLVLNDYTASILRQL